MMVCALPLLSDCLAAEVQVDVERVSPQILTIHRDDLVRWIGSSPPSKTVESFNGDFKFVISESSEWSAAYRFTIPGTNYYRRYFGEADIPGNITSRSGIVIVRDWANQPPAISLNSPVEDFVFIHEAEPIPLLATVRMENSRVQRVEFRSNDTVVTTVTNAPYFVPRAKLPLGQHTLVARVVEPSGLVHDSTPVRITVQQIEAPVLSIGPVQDKNLVVVSWLTPPGLGVLHMGRAEDVRALTAMQTSSTSGAGVRFWIERVRPNSHVFFNIRQRF